MNQFQPPCIKVLKLYYADIKADTLCIDPLAVERKIASKTAGVILVHLADLIYPELKKLSKLCQDNNIFLLEEAANAYGEIYKGYG